MYDGTNERANFLPNFGQNRPETKGNERKVYQNRRNASVGGGGGAK